MRLFVVLNETDAEPHIDVRNALMKLTADGVIDEYHVFPFLADLRRRRPSEEVIHELILGAILFQPDAMLWAHTGGLEITRDALRRVREKCNNPVFGYWDGDLYQLPYKQMPPEVVQLASFSDVVFVQGFGQMTDQLFKAGAKHIEFVPAPTDEWRFAKARKGSLNPPYDVVMIGNSISSRLPWRNMPGSRWRRDVVSVLEKNLGSRFAVFGNGWYGPSAAGPIPFDQQLIAYHDSRIAVGVNNLHAQYYFSNRLPTAMASGIPVVHNYEIGFEKLFPGDFGPFFFRETSKAWLIIKKLLEKDQSELDEIGSKAREFAMRRFSITVVLQFIVSTLKLYSDRNKNGASGRLHVNNPWLGS